MRIAMILCGYLILIQGCGIKGPPVPPQEPETIQKQKGDSSAQSQTTQPLNQTQEAEKKIEPKKSKKK